MSKPADYAHTWHGEGRGMTWSIIAKDELTGAFGVAHRKLSPLARSCHTAQAEPECWQLRPWQTRSSASTASRYCTRATPPRRMRSSSVRLRKSAATRPPRGGRGEGRRGAAAVRSDRRPGREGRLIGHTRSRAMPGSLFEDFGEPREIA